MADLELSFESGESSLSVRRFAVHEAISKLFTVSVWARSPDASIDLESITGKTASLRIENGLAFAPFGGTRSWVGICSTIAQVAVDTGGLSTYHLQIVPSLWRLAQRRNHRIFQHVTIPELADVLFKEWGIAPEWSIDRAKYPKLEYRVQYGETDYAFLSRMLEEAGIAFTFVDGGAGDPKLILGDELHGATPRAALPIPYVDHPNQAAQSEFVTDVKLGLEVRPGAYAIRDYDFRRPDFSLLGEAPKAAAPEDRYEQYRYLTSGALVETPTAVTTTPAADDKATARHDEQAVKERAARTLEAVRTGRRALSFNTNAVDLRPGTVFSINLHPHPELGVATMLLVTELSLEGAPGSEWTTRARAVFTDTPYRPRLDTPKPRVRSVQSATIVGPSGQEIHTDEHGRVRVQFPWDRVGKNNDGSSCWVRVSQGWAGPGFGMLALPRIGHEVLVAFFDGNPDAPVVVGRVFDTTNPVPYKLPEHKTRGTWKSDSSPLSDGFNEILFEDLKSSELVYLQAQKNLRRLVKNDETSTVGHDREKVVELNELETVDGDRIEVIVGNRCDTTSDNRVTVVGGRLQKLVKGDEIERFDAEQVTRVGKELHVIVEKDRKEQIKIDHHVHVEKCRSESVGAQSLLVGKSQNEKVGRHHALEAKTDIHLKALTVMVGEAPDITIKGAGGFIRIDASGVTIVGTMVNINVSGSAGSAADSCPSAPKPPREAMVTTTYTLAASWLDTSAYCGGSARLQGLVTPAPPDGPATIEVILASTGATLATINSAVTGGRVGAVWTTKAPTATWRTDVLQFRITIPSIGLSGVSLNNFMFRQRPVTGWVLLNIPHASNGGFAPVHEKHDAALELDRVHYELKPRLFGAPFGPTKQAAAKAQIENVWNTGFANKKFHRTGCARGRTCDCAFDCCKAGWHLDVNFVSSGEHLAIEVFATVPPARPHRSSMNGDGGEWGDPALSPASTYPHETGHVLGQADEYPTGATDPTGVQPANAPGNLLSTPGNTTLLIRHYRWALKFLNDNAGGDLYETIQP